MIVLKNIQYNVKIVINNKTKKKINWIQNKTKCLKYNNKNLMVSYFNSINHVFRFINPQCLKSLHVKSNLLRLHSLERLTFFSFLIKPRKLIQTIDIRLFLLLLMLFLIQDELPCSFLVSLHSFQVSFLLNLLHLDNACRLSLDQL